MTSAPAALGVTASIDPPSDMSARTVPTPTRLVLTPPLVSDTSVLHQPTPLHPPPDNSRPVLSPLIRPPFSRPLMPCLITPSPTVHYRPLHLKSLPIRPSTPRQTTPDSSPQFPLAPPPTPLICPPPTRPIAPRPIRLLHSARPHHGSIRLLRSTQPHPTARAQPSPTTPSGACHIATSPTTRLSSCPDLSPRFTSRPDYPPRLKSDYPVLVRPPRLLGPIQTASPQARLSVSSRYIYEYIL